MQPISRSAYTLLIISILAYAAIVLSRVLQYFNTFRQARKHFCVFCMQMYICHSNVNNVNFIFNLYFLSGNVRITLYPIRMRDRQGRREEIRGSVGGNVMKKFIACLLFAAMLLPFAYTDAQACTDVTADDVELLLERIDVIYSNGYPEGSMTLSCIKDAAWLCGMSSASENGAICIFEVSGGGYLVTLGGTELTNNEENIGIKEDLLSGFNQSNEYKNSVIAAMQATIPEGSDVYIYGYSLGGMVLQQVLADKQIKGHYEFKSAVAIGSPVTSIARQKIIFIEDVNDLVPHLSGKSFLAGKLFRKYDNHIVRDGGYKTTAGGHALSYVDSDIWNDIDIFGGMDGASLVINMDSLKTFYA